MISRRTEDEEVERFCGDWYRRCVELACAAEPFSVVYLFWWSCRWQFNDVEQRRLWAHDPERALDEWVAYFVGQMLWAERWSAL